MMNFKQLLEGKNISIIMKKKYPNVITQIIGPFSPEYGENGYFILQMILVKYNDRQKGLGTKYMNDLINEAKKQKLDIFLSPSDDYQEPEEMNLKDITNWYKKLGFVKKHKDDFRTTDIMCYYS